MDNRILEEQNYSNNENLKKDFTVSNHILNRYRFKPNFKF